MYEVRKICADRLSFWNLIAIVELGLVLYIVLDTEYTEFFDLKVETLRILAAFACCLTLCMLFNWLRLFDFSAFYVLLIIVTIKDVSPFLGLLLTALMMFGVPIVMLDATSSSDKKLIEDAFNFWPLDLIYNQYLLAIGKDRLASYDDHPQEICV